ncbi:MAG TPA: hypothetical protein VN408_15850 [Actinoplanes sp.]|nr:hypothetical protein [Actinoplanes sp.]
MTRGWARAAGRGATARRACPGEPPPAGEDAGEPPALVAGADKPPVVAAGAAELPEDAAGLPFGVVGAAVGWWWVSSGRGGAGGGGGVFSRTGNGVVGSVAR